MSGAATSQTWDYLTVQSDATAGLNELGRQGWELVGVGGTAVPLLYFKRPAPDFRTRVTLDQKRRTYAEAGLAVTGNVQ